MTEPVKHSEGTSKRLEGRHHLGYVLAILAPPIGLVYGLALVAASDDEGPAITGFSVFTWVLYFAVAIAVGGGVSVL